MAQSIHWECLQFDELSAEKLFAILHERQTVFVLEQQCLYPDIDAIDRQSLHLIGWAAGENQQQCIAAYLRILPPGSSYPEASMGRVLVSASARGGGLGEELMQRGIAEIKMAYPESNIRISAQHYLERFYQRIGFTTTSDVYDEDGIPHIDMLMTAN